MMAPGTVEVYEKDAHRLIECVTNLKIGDESFDQCVDYAVSNFRYSRFLDVNRHSVLRSIDGLCRKFLIHSQTKKAEALESLSRNFVQSRVFKDLNIVNSDVQYSLLCLLIHLANNPTASNDTYVQEVGESAVAGEDEMNDLRWRSYLMEDETGYDALLSNSSDLSDWSDCDDQKLDGDGEEHKVREDGGFSSLGLLRCAADLKSRNEVTGRSWLCRHVQSPYWGLISLDSAVCAGRSSSRNLTSNLRSEWEDHVQQSSIMQLPPGVSVELTERQISREALWMLGGRRQLFVFDCVDESFTVREGVVVSHLTEKCLRELLVTLTTCSSELLKLRCFVDKFAFDCTPRLSSGFCRIYQAYASALSSVLLDFDRVVCGLERVVVEQRQSFTLTMLLDRLEPWINTIDVLAKVHETVLESELESVALSARVCHFLQELFFAAVNYSSEGNYSVSILLPLFLKTARPYMEMIDSWVTLGCLCDQHGEFFIERNGDVSMSHEKFWEVSVVVKCVCPSFMEPVIDLLLVTGKSMELLRCLGKLPEVARCGGKLLLRSLYDTFIERVGCELYDTRVENLGKNEDVCVSSFVKTPGPVWKTILAKNFDNSSITPDGVSPWDEGEASKWWRSLDVRFGCSIKDVLSSCFSKEISVCCGRTCNMLMVILNEEHGLIDDLLSIRRFWLMEAGDVLFHFYSQVFEKIPREDIWSEELNLRIILDDVLLTFSPRDVSRISVRVDVAVVDKCISPINCYDGIRLYYRKPWPLDLVVSRSMWDVYDSIFTFLLQVKWAKYALDELRFSDLKERVDVVTFLKEIHATRIKLLHFVNSFHDYMMTTVLCGANDPTPWNGSTNLQNTMDEHGRYLLLIQEQCLLHPNMQLVHCAICKVLNVAIVFHDSWKGIDAKRMFSSTLLMDVENELSNCRRFLSELLHNTSSPTSQKFLFQVESLVLVLGGVVESD